jgi:hypothetical protein
MMRIAKCDVRPGYLRNWRKYHDRGKSAALPTRMRV